MMTSRETERIANDAGVPVVSLRKERATWYWFVTNPQGGGFGSNVCGPQKSALWRALMPYVDGTSYRLVVNGQDRGIQVKGAGQ